VEGGFWKSGLKCFSGQSWEMKPEEVKRKLLKKAQINDGSKREAQQIMSYIRNSRASQSLFIEENTRNR
jgi:hypothetical protein